MGAPYCPKGNNYRYWPIFSSSNMEYIGNGQIVNGSSIVANAPAILGGAVSKIRPLTINGPDLVGTHIEAYLSNVQVGKGTTIANNGRIIGICLYQDANMLATLYGIWFSYNVYSGGGRWVWHGTGPAFTGLSPINLSFGPHGIYLSMDFVSKSFVGGQWNHDVKFTLSFTSGVYSGTSYTYTATSLLVGTSPAYVGFFFNNGNYWRDYNTCVVDSVFAWGPTVVGKKCGKIFDLMQFV